MQPRFLAISGLPTGLVHPLVDGRLSIGRDVSNELRLQERRVSRKHCMVRPADRGHEIVDLESHNGTFVNGVPVKLKVIEHGDTIRVGSSEFVFLTHEGEEAQVAKLRLQDAPSELTLTTVASAQQAGFPGLGAEVGRMARDLAALVKISHIIHSIRDLERMQTQLLQLILEVIPADQAAVLLLSDPDDIEAGSICTWSRTLGGGHAIECSREIVQKALWERSSVLSAAAALPAAGPGPGSVLCVPLVAIERTLGVLYLTSPRRESPFREDHVHFGDSVARIAAVTLENLLALDALRSENRRLNDELHPRSKLVGESRQMLQVADFIARVAGSAANVLIRGESGTGKEVVAQAIHQGSPRHDRPFVAINCAAIPETLIESELFGHEKGSFTGAVGTRKGRLETAEDGTLFLDEIGELVPAMQAKLLRVLQQREFERVGGTRPIALRARVLAATNKDLEQAIKKGEFRQDLYYRLNVVCVTVPPLREHREDVPLLALYFAAKLAQKNKRSLVGISPEARRLLTGYNWPGNVRELENAIEHAVVLGLTEEILPEDLPVNILEEQTAASCGSRYQEALNQTKKELVLGALLEANHNFPEAARLLGVHPKYLHRLVRNLGLRDREAGEAD